MTINLADFLNKEVTVVLRNGESYTGVISHSLGKVSPCVYAWFPYFMEAEAEEVLVWNTDGRWTHYTSGYDIVQITLKLMNPEQQLLQTIQETEEKLSKLKEQLEQLKPPTIQEAKVGDILEDYSIVIKKENGLALVLAPKFTEVYYVPWTKEFSDAYSNLATCGFIPSQWFIPSIEQLQLAYDLVPNEFNNDNFYWSSNETREEGAIALKKNSFGGIRLCEDQGHYKLNRSHVRAVRCISY